MDRLLCVAIISSAFILKNEKVYRNWDLYQVLLTTWDLWNYLIASSRSRTELYIGEIDCPVYKMKLYASSECIVENSLG